MRKLHSFIVAKFSIICALYAASPVFAGVVGTGTAASCTQSALQTQISAGGTVTFNCGGPATIAIATGLGINSSNPAVVVDGGGIITLDGATISPHAPMISIYGGSSTLPSITFKGMTFSNGNATGTGLQSGGAILNGGNLTLDNDVFNNNQAPFGGAVAQERCSSSGSPPTPCVAASLTVTNSTFSNNSASNSGGAINLQSDTVSVSNSTFAGNSAGSGGAVYLFGNSTFTASGTIANSTFNGNSASSSGGAIAATNLQGGSVTLTNDTIAGNSATTNGGGVYVTSTLTMQDTLLASNTGGNCNVGSFSGTNNLQFGDGTCAGVPTADPHLGALANNGGPTQTMALGAGSAAIDAGNNATCPAADQRGFARADGDGNGSVICDVGAYEAAAGTTSPTNTLTASPSTTTEGQSIVLTATTNNANFTKVTISIANTVICQDVVLSSGSATCNFDTTGWTVNSQPVTATFCNSNCDITAAATALVTITAPAVNGVCGSDNGKTLSVQPINLCSAGTPSAVTGNGVSWSWTCAGSGGGTTANCSANVSVPPPTVAAPLLHGAGLLTLLLGLCGIVLWRRQSM